MSVTPTPHLEAKIQERIASGRYRDAQEVIGDALRLLEEHERLQHLRALLEVGRQDEPRGDWVRFSPEWMADLRRRVEEPSPDVVPS
jgi:putative addiction module CopG family antidote